MSDRTSSHDDALKKRDDDSFEASEGPVVHKKVIDTDAVIRTVHVGEFDIPSGLLPCVLSPR